MYAQDTVVHMLSRKALARVVRGHLLVDSELNTMVTAQVVDVPFLTESGETTALEEQ